MTIKLLTKEVGPYSMNTYVIIDEDTKESAIVDPGGDPEEILAMTAGTVVKKILITHGHGDHIMALDDIKMATGAPIYLHPADGVKFNLRYDEPLGDGDEISIGASKINVIHVPGHTPGQCCFDLGDNRIIVGDTVFVGGPGRTASPQDFAATMKNMHEIVFNWPKSTQFFPGHGPSGKISDEKSAFDRFVDKGWPEDTQGDVTWE